MVLPHDQTPCTSTPAHHLAQVCNCILIQAAQKSSSLIQVPGLAMTRYDVQLVSRTPGLPPNKKSDRALISNL